MTKSNKYAMWFLIGILAAVIVFDIYLDANDTQQTISQWVLACCLKYPLLPFYIGIGIGSIRTYNVATEEIKSVCCIKTRSFRIDTYQCVRGAHPIYDKAREARIKAHEKRIQNDHN